MRPILRNLFLVSALLFATQACGTGNEAHTLSIAPEQLAALIASGDAPFVLDVRTEGEFSAGHIPGAVNIPHDELAGRLAELPSDHGTEIVVHCKSGQRAQTATSVLAEAGFTNLVDLTGHMQGWREGNLPLE